MKCGHLVPVGIASLFIRFNSLDGVRPRLDRFRITSVDSYSAAMNFKYRWKNHQKPNRDEAVKREELLDESQFTDPTEQALAETDARRLLNVPLPVEGDRIPSEEPEAGLG